MSSLILIFICLLKVPTFVYIANLWENVMIVMNVNYTDRQMFCDHNLLTQESLAEILDYLVPSLPTLLVIYHLSP